VVIATPDHWHADLAIAACQAGKDVYLEQPVALTIAEGERVVQVARQTGRIVQTGLPQRSGAHFQSAVAAVQAGEIGSVHAAKAWAVHKRKTLPPPVTSKAPLGVDYTRWLGSAPQREFSRERFHQHWPWFWDYGAGELGLWGVQMLDVVRWGLNLELPSSVIAAGGIRVLKDGRETPDTLKAFFDYPDLTVSWEHRQWSSRGIEGRTNGVAFYGTEGTLIVDRGGWKIYDRKESLAAAASEIHAPHITDFLNSVRTRQTPVADIALGAQSMALCHMANLAYRTGQAVRPTPFTGEAPVLT
jgi:predicted dehydrogenase